MKDNFYSIEQLADTTTSDIPMSEVISKKVEEVAREARVFRSYLRFDDSLRNKPGVSVAIPRREPITSDLIAEGGTLDASTLSFSTAATIIPVEHGAAFAISRQAVERGSSIIQGAIVELGHALSQEEDEDIAVEMSTATSNVLWAGASSSTADILATDVITPELVLRGVRDIKGNNYKPRVLVVSSNQEYQLGTCEQFSSAAVYGGSDYVKSGEIPKFAGLEVVTSPNLVTGLGGLGTDIPYTVCLLFTPNESMAMAVKRPITIDREYKPLSRKYVIAGTYDRDEKVVNDSSIALLYCADGA